MYYILQDENQTNRSLPDITDIENSEDIDMDDTLETYVEGDDITYSSGETAKILGISRDKFRFCIQGLEDYLPIEKTSSKKRAHLRFHSKDIDLLRSVVKMRQDGKPVELVREILADPNLLSYISTGNQYNAVLVEMLTKSNEALIEQIKLLFKEQQLLDEKKTLVIEDKQSLLRQQNSALQDQVNQLSNQVDALTDLINERLPEKNEKKGIFRFLHKKD